MSYKIEVIAPFSKQLKRLLKKYPSLKDEYSTLLDLLEKEPEKGTHIGYNCYKIRISIASKGKGKSGGARVIYYLKISETRVVLLSIYDKSEQDDIDGNELKELLAKIF